MPELLSAAPRLAPTAAGRSASTRPLLAVATAFARHRRGQDDVMYLKENGELLLVVLASRARGGGEVAELYGRFHAQAPAFFDFFPQYYRLILSIVSDLEELGLPDTVAGPMAQRVAQLGLPGGELSDLPRMEARRLCGRHGIEALPEDRGLFARALSFMDRPRAFTVPNRKAAYDLTHFVYYLSDYGRRPLELPEGVSRSLLNVGMIALMEEDVDLVAEVCLALRFLGQAPPAYWERYVAADLAEFELQSEDADDEDEPLTLDDYHPYLVANWHQAVAGGRYFYHSVRPGRITFHRREENRCALSEISRILLQLKGENVATVGGYYERLRRRLSPRSRNVLEMVGASCPQFDEFFHGFCHRGPAMAARA